MAKVYLRQNNLRPVLNTTLTDANDDPIDLSGETLQFVMNTSSGGAKIDATSTGSAVTIVGATSGHVRYTWQDGDTDTAGNFLAEWRRINSSTEAASHPNYGYIEVLISPGLST